MSPGPGAVRDPGGSKKAQLLAKVSIFSQAVDQAKDRADALKAKAKDKADALKYQGTLNRKRCFTLLIIANPSVDWSVL